MTAPTLEQKLQQGFEALQKKQDEAIERIEKGDTVTNELKSQIQNLTGDLQKTIDQVRDMEEKGLGPIGGEKKAKSLLSLIGENPAYKDVSIKGNARADIEIKGDELAAAMEKKTLVTAGGSNLVVPHYDRNILTGPRNDHVIRSLMRSIPVENTEFVYFQENLPLSLNAGMVAEGGRKPETSASFTRKQDTVKKIAVWIPITEEAANDLPQLMAYLDGLLRYDVLQKEEDQILRGDGTGQNMNGIITQATAYDPNIANGKSTDTAIDIVRRMLYQSRRNTRRTPDAVVMSDLDWMDIELLKDNENRYMFANLQGLVSPVLWGRPVAVSDSMDEDTGEILVGPFAQGALLYDRTGITVRIGWINDDFVKNQFVLLVEKRVGLGVILPDGFIKHQLRPATGGGGGEP